MNEQVRGIPIGQVLFTLLQVGASFLWLNDLHRFARDRRTQYRKALPKPFHGSSPAEPDHHISYLVVQAVVIMAGGIVAILGLT